MKTQQKPVVLIILDGLGLSNNKKGNAPALADTPFLDSLYEDYNWIALHADGLNVGLPQGQMGNSEVGHMNIGSGRVVYQELTRIDRDIRTGDFYNNEVLTGLMDKLNKERKPLHVWGLLSEGGVHSHIEHLFALLELARTKGQKDVFIHAVTDGRDVPPKSALKDVDMLESFIKKIGIGKIKTVMGRYYAMDRDRRWDRTEKAYKAFKGEADIIARNAREAVEMAYEREELDEFITPTNIKGDGEQDLDVSEDEYVTSEDGMICFNFRPDRARQMTSTLIEKEDLNYVCFTQYDFEFHLPVAYPPQELENIAGEYLASKGKSQLRIAETEKYAHVTFFFNGGKEEAYQREDRLLIPSPRVDTYDKKPQMSAFEITKEAKNKMLEKKYDFVLINYANPDMVGHTGDLKACIKAMETIDKCLHELITFILDEGWMAIVTSDHGNAEMMIDDLNGGAHTAHTNNPVPFILVDKNKGFALKDLEKPKLADIIPTVLNLMWIEKPEEMTGRSLLKLE